MDSKILLVDDDSGRGEEVRAILAANSYPETRAVSCQDALALLPNEKFDLIIVDIALPNKIGASVLELLRKNHLASKVIVITGTGTSGFENAILTATLRARDYILKPLDPSLLLKSVDHILSDRSRKNFKLQIINAGDFIKSTPAGDLDLALSKQGFAQIAAAGLDLDGYTVLIDLRNVRSKLSTTDIYELGSHLTTYGNTFRRNTAVLVLPDKGIEAATFFEQVAQNRGFEVRAFTVFEDAVNWLSSIV